MAAIEEDILAEFYRQLSGNAEVPSSMVDALRTLLSTDAKLKPEDLVAIFAPPQEDEIP